MKNNAAMEDHWSNNPRFKEALAEQPAPPPECKTDAEKTAFAFGWWKALEENRKQPAQEQEPVAWRSWNDHDGYGFWETKQEAEPWCAPDFFAEPLYTSPPASKPWVGLTEQERKRAIQFNNAHEALAVVIEAKLKEKNGA